MIRSKWHLLNLGSNVAYRQIVGFPMGTNCAPLAADLFVFCYEREFTKDLSNDNEVDIIKAFNLTSATGTTPQFS